MKWNKLVSVVSACFALVGFTNVCVGSELSLLPFLGITNVPLSFTGTVYFTSYHEPEYDGGYQNISGCSTISNLVKHSGNLVGKSAYYTTNYTQYVTNGFTYASYYTFPFNTSVYIEILNEDPAFYNNYDPIPTNAVLSYNLQTGKFWLMNTNGFAFSLSDSWWFYSWTNVVRTSRMTDTTVYTVSNTFASSISPAARVTGFYHDTCDNYYCITNSYVPNNDFEFQAVGEKQVASGLLGYTTSLNNETSSSQIGFNGFTNIEAGEVYLSTGPDVQFAMVGPSTIVATQSASTNGVGKIMSAATTMFSMNTALSGVISTIEYTNSCTTNYCAKYEYEPNFNSPLVTVEAGFTGAVSGYKTNKTVFFFNEDP